MREFLFGYGMALVMLSLAYPWMFEGHKVTLIMVFLAIVLDSLPNDIFK